MSISKESLEREYVVNGKSCREIGEMLGVTHSTVSTWLTKYGIPKRTGTRKGKLNKQPSSKTNLAGQTFGDLTVIKYVRGGWSCRCSCGQTKIYGTRRLTHDGVVSCGCRHKIHGSQHHLWKGHGDISMSLYGRYFHHAVDRGIMFNVSIEYLWNLYQQQDGKCALTGEPITFDTQNTTASLDRIDSSGDYTNDNVQWVHKVVNQIKWDLSPEDLTYWCRLIIEHSS